MIATYHSHLPIVKLLLGFNADIAIQDCFGKRAIHRAKEPTILKILQRAEGIQVDSPTRSPRASTVKSPKNSAKKAALKNSSSTNQINRMRETNKSTKTQSPSQSQSRLGKSDSRTSISSESEKKKDLKFKPSKPQVIQRSSSRASSGTPSRSAKSPSVRSTSPNHTFNSSSMFTSKDGPSPVHKRLLFKEELSKTLVEQIGFYAQRMQTFLLQKVNYDVPLLVQGQQERIRKELEHMINSRLNSIMKSMSTHFNLKIKFCLNKAGYDTNSSDIKSFLENDDLHGLEVAPIHIPKDSRVLRREQDDLDRLEKLRKQVQKIESDIKNSRLALPVGDQLMVTQQSQFKDDNSVGNRWQVRDELEQQLNHEVKANMLHLTDHTTQKVQTVVREERNNLQKKILEELTTALEIIEDRMRSQLEDIIDEKISAMCESIGTPYRKTQSPYKNLQNTSGVDNNSPRPTRENESISEAHSVLLNRSLRDFRPEGSGMSFRESNSPSRLSPTKARLMNELDEVRMKGDVNPKLADKTHGNFEPRPNYKQDEISSMRSTGALNRIQGLKDDLNYNFQESPDRILNSTLR